MLIDHTNIINSPNHKDGLTIWITREDGSIDRIEMDYKETERFINLLDRNWDYVNYKKEAE